MNLLFIKKEKILQIIVIGRQNDNWILFILRLFTLFVLIGFISGQVSSYSGTSSQNSKLYKLRPELRGEQFYKRVIAWQELSSRYTDLDHLELIEHEIVSGESFWGISNYYDISFDDLIEINKIKKSEAAIVGRKLIIPIQKNILPNINDTSEIDPCNDAKYLALHEKGVDNLTDDEFDYYIDIFVRCPGSRKPTYVQKKAVQKQTLSKSLLNEKKLNKVSELALVESKSSKKSSNSTYTHKKKSKSIQLPENAYRQNGLVPSPYNKIPGKEKIDMMESPDFGILLLESNAPKSVVISAEIPTYGISQFEWNQNIIALPYGLYTITSNHKGYYNFKKIVIVERQKTKVVSIFIEKIPKLRYLKKWQFTILNIALVADNSFRMFQFINNKKEKWAKLDYAMLFSFPFYHVSSLFLSSKIQNYLFYIKNKESIKDEKRNKLGDKAATKKRYGENIYGVNNIEVIYDDGKIRTLEISCDNGMIWNLKIAVGLYDKHFINTKKPQKIKDRLFILHEDAKIGGGLLVRFDVDGKRDLNFFVHRQY